MKKDVVRLARVPSGLDDLFQKGRYLEVCERLLDLVGSCPEDPALWYCLGKAYAAAGGVVPAEECLRKAVDLDDTSLRSTYFLNLHRIRHHASLSRDRPRLLIGGLINARHVWMRGFRSFADVIQMVPSREDGGGVPEDLVLYDPADDAFEDIARRLPGGWEPDLVLWMIPEWKMYPRGIERSPWPTAAFIGDRDTGWVKIGHDLGFFDTIACNDFESVEVYERLGARRVLRAPFYSYFEKDIFRCTQAVRDIDGVFIGGIRRSYMYPAYRFRDRVLRTLAGLSGSHRVLIREHYPGSSPWMEHGALGFTPSMHTLLDDEITFFSPPLARYAETLNRARIGIIANAQKQIHPMMLEVMGCGALAFVEDDNDAVRRCFTHGEDLILYNEDNLERLFRYYIDHPMEREAIAAKGRERCREFSASLVLRQGCDILMGGREAPGDRPAARLVQADLLTSRGCALYWADQVEEAAACFRRSLEIRPYDTNSSHDLGVALSILAARSADLALAAEAEEHIGRALLLDEDNALALFNMICLRHHVLDEDFHKEYTQLCRLLDSGEPSSLADFDGGIFYYPNLSGGKQFDLMRNEMSGAFLSSLSKGSMYFERIASIVRWRVESMRAERLRQERRHMEALAAMERAAGGSVVDPSLEYGIAVHGGVLGEMEKALRYCDRAVAHNPLAMEPCSQKIDLLCALGRYEEALSFCRGILTMADAFDDSYYLGWRERFRSLRSEIESRISAEHALT